MNSALVLIGLAVERSSAGETSCAALTLASRDGGYWPCTFILCDHDRLPESKPV